MRIIEAEDVQRVLDFPAVIEALRKAFGSPAGTPPRTMYKLDKDPASSDVFALLPSWTEEAIGVKAFTYLPSNAAKGRKILYSKVLLFDRETGEPLALVDGTFVTYWRTAAVGALAADYLARKDARRLVVCGTGNLAPYMTLAHASVRPITDVGIWGRTPGKAAQTIERIREKRPDLNCTVVTDLAAAVGEADIVSVATASKTPVVLGAWVKKGTHTDFFGNHERHVQECDSDLVAKSRLYADSRDNVMNEAGEILIPISEGLIPANPIIGDLADLCSGRVKGRGSDDETTLFKSVGTPLSDLATAQLVAKRVSK
ncbi:MAG: ornithine cyclodeaminase family protein [Gemmatimonadota bacterium]